jgi:acetylglutamate kinase
MDGQRLIIDCVPHKLLISITSPFNLLRELFTVKGAGTMLRRGAIITVHHDYQNVDTHKLASLLQESFGRPPRADFFQRPVSRIYLEENYRGVAILVDTQLGGYLTKLAVERQAQGEGLGHDIWVRLEADCPTFFWRARFNNPINDWYLKEADGTARFPTWQIFWKGLEVEKIAEAIRYALAQPDDMNV